MADRIKGITVEIGGDTTGLNKALSGVNKEIKSTESQLKDVERLLKLDPGNTQLLEQKQRLLAEAVEGTKDKLETLKTAEKQAQEQFKKGEISQQQYEGLQREIIDTTQQLEKLEDQASRSNVALSKISTGAGKVSDVTGGIANATRGLSATAGGAVVGLVGMAVAAGKSADDINTLAKQTGLSVEQIQKFQYATDSIDVPLETLTGSMAKLTKNMATASKGTGDAKAAFDALGVSVTNQDGTLRDNQEVFNEAITALGKMENGTQRDALAMQIFGKSAQDLNPLILGGADALTQLGQEAEDAGLILSEDTLNSANEFNDAIDTLKATAVGTFASVGAEIATDLTPFLQDLADVVKNLLHSRSPPARLIWIWPLDLLHGCIILSCT